MTKTTYLLIAGALCVGFGLVACGSKDGKPLTVNRGAAKTGEAARKANECKAKLGRNKVETLGKERAQKICAFVAPKNLSAEQMKELQAAPYALGTGYEPVELPIRGTVTRVDTVTPAIPSTGTRVGEQKVTRSTTIEAKFGLKVVLVLHDEVAKEKATQIKNLLNNSCGKKNHPVMGRVSQWI